MAINFAWHCGDRFPWAPLLLAGVITVIGCRTVSNVSPESDRGVLAIHSGLPGESEHTLVDLQGHRIEISRALGVRVVPFFAAVWSPSGRNLAFLCRLAQDGPMLICNADLGRSAVINYPLPEDGTIVSLEWAKDDTGLLYAWRKRNPAPVELWRVDAYSGQTILLGHLLQGVDTLAWSPDRSQVAFPAPSSPTKPAPWWQDENLYVQDVVSGTRTLLQANVAGEVVWSPNGTQIAFTTDSPCWIPPTGGGATCATVKGGGLTWSPDGKELAFFTEDGIHTVNVETHHTRTVLGGKGNVGWYDLAWSPDGKYLAYDACCCIKPNDGCEVYIVSVDGRRHWQLTQNKVADEYPIWQPIPSTGQNQ